MYLSTDSRYAPTTDKSGLIQLKWSKMLWFRFTAKHNRHLFDSRLLPFIRLLMAFHSYCYETASRAFIIPTLNSSEICNCCVWHLCLLAVSVETTEQWELEAVNNFLNALYNDHRDFLTELTSRNHSKKMVQYWKMLRKSDMRDKFRFYSHHRIKAVTF